MLEFKPGTKGAHSPPEKMFAPLEKCVGDSLKQLKTVLKNRAPLRKLFAVPLVPIWLLACLSSLHVSFKPSCYKT